MNWDGNGTFKRKHHWEESAKQGIKLSPKRLDEEFDNFKKGLEACLTINGETKASKNLSMENFRHVNVGEAKELNHYARADQVQNNSFINGGIARGEKDHYEIKLYPSPNQLLRGQKFSFLAHQNNDGESIFLKINEFDKKPIMKRGKKKLAPNDILKDAMIEVIYDGEAFQLASLAADPIIHFPDQIAAIRSQLLPTGLVSAFASDKDLEGWLLCDGRILNAKANPQFKPLFDVIGTLYGGTSSENFHLPDLRGRVIAGLEGTTGRLENLMSGNQLGSVGGKATHLLTLDELPSHGHKIGNVNRSETNHKSAILGNVKPLMNSLKEGGDKPHNNLQPTMTLYYMIKL